MDNGVLLSRISDALATPAPAFPDRLSALLSALLPHAALVMLTADAQGGRLRGTGDHGFVRNVRALDLDRLRNRAHGAGPALRVSLNVGGSMRDTLQVLSRNGALLVLAEPGWPEGAPGDDLGAAEPVRTIVEIWNIVACTVQDRADDAAPDYLQQARRHSGTRLDALAELTDAHSTAFEALLALLRSPHLSDAEARSAAIGLAAESLLELRSTGVGARALSEEPIAAAFETLRNEMRAVLQHRGVEAELIAPPAHDAGLPGEIARGARALTVRAVLGLLQADGADGTSTTRMRIEWRIDDARLLIGVRDDGAGEETASATLSAALRQRVEALGGRTWVEATPGWGTIVGIALPIEPPRPAPTSVALLGLRPRELQVAELLLAGHRNRSIAAELGISENTVKFHVSRVLQKLGATSRGEAIAKLSAERRAPSPAETALA